MHPDRQKQFSDIIQLIKNAQSNAFSVVNAELINLYWNVGKYISNQLVDANWGDKTVEELAAFIQKDHPEIKGFNKRGLYRMKQFYETYSSMSFVSSLMTQKQITDNQRITIASSPMTQFDNIKETILTKISWTHHLTLITRAKTDEEREFYIQLCIKERYTVRELDRQIDSGIFERMMIGNTKIPAKIKEIHPDAKNNLKDDYIFEFLGLLDSHSEGDLQTSLISQMKNFVLELGKDIHAFIIPIVQGKYKKKKDSLKPKNSNDKKSWN